MNVERTPLDGLLIFTLDVYGDERGFFMESFSKKRYKKAGAGQDFVQDNVSLSGRGVLRGLHFQRAPHAQGKLAQVLRGKVWDVAVDIRKGSETYGKWHGLELSEENRKQFWIPPGFAHGFVTLEENTLFTYKCTDYYMPEYEDGIIWNDPDLAINWPLEDVTVSEKDQKNEHFNTLTC